MQSYMWSSGNKKTFFIRLGACGYEAEKRDRAVPQYSYFRFFRDGQRLAWRKVFFEQHKSRLIMRISFTQHNHKVIVEMRRNGEENLSLRLLKIDKFMAKVFARNDVFVDIFSVHTKNIDVLA